MFDIRRHIEICHLVTFVCFDLVCGILQQPARTHMHGHTAEHLLHTSIADSVVRMGFGWSVISFAVRSRGCARVYVRRGTGSTTIIKDLVYSIDDVRGDARAYHFPLFVWLSHKFANRFSPATKFGLFTTDGVMATRFCHGSWTKWQAASFRGCQNRKKNCLLWVASIASSEIVFYFDLILKPNNEDGRHDSATISNFGE